MHTQSGPTQGRRFVARMLGPVRAGLLFGGVLVAASTGALGDGAIPPPDGIYTNVTVEGRAAPVIHVKDGGTVILVDTDGHRPRIWREQFKRQGNLPPGAYNIHKTNVNLNDTFADDPIDRRGLWTIDGQGNITAH